MRARTTRWKTNSAQFRTRVTRHQHSGTAQHHPRVGRSQSVDGRQEVLCWIAHTPAKLSQIIIKTVQKRIRSFREVNQVTEPNKTPQNQCAEKRDPQGAKTVEVATGAVCSTSTVLARRYSITEVSQQQYMNVEVPAEVQCPEIQCQNTTTQHNRFHSRNGDIRTS